MRRPHAGRARRAARRPLGSPNRRRSIGLLLAVLALAGCGQEQSLGPCDDSCVPSLHTRCEEVGSDLSCVLFDQENRDLTLQGHWSVSGPARVEAPGVVRTTGYGEIVISVSGDLLYGRTRDVARYLADPPRTARRLWWISGDVVDGANGKPLAGVRVMALDGYNAGRHSFTNERGGYQLEPLLTGEDFTYQAEKTGYRTLTGRYRLGDPSGPLDPLASGPFLDLRLARIEGGD